MYKKDNKNRNMRIEKNFLEQKDFEKLYKTIMNNWFGWFYVDHVADESDTANGYFAHMIYDNHERRSNEGWDMMQPILNKLKPKALIRIKDETYGYCLDTAEPIGLKRLMARPVAKYTIAAQEKHEKDEKVHADD